MTGHAVALLGSSLLLAACAHPPYPPPVQSAFLERCAHELWPAYCPARPAEITAYCQCMLREQERVWSLRHYNEEWRKIDTGYYKTTPPELLGLFPRGRAHYPHEVVDAIRHCLTAHDEGAEN